MAVTLCTIFSISGLGQDGDNASVSEVLSSRDLEKIQNYVSGYELVVIDKAQRIVGEPLVGRAFDYKLYPVFQKELLPINLGADRRSIGLKKERENYPAMNLNTKRTKYQSRNFGKQLILKLSSW